MVLKNLKTILTLILITISTTTFAQDGSDDFNYDPFADYSEFEASAEEEADIHFFKNGRFFNLALMIGGRAFTGNLGEITEPAPAFGVYMAYFFDIRSALQISYSHSNHSLNIPANPATNYLADSGATSLSNIALHYKYYFNTANITRGFANFNPFIIAGFSMNLRTINLVNEDISIKSSPSGMEAGFGVEIPISRNKMYLGLQVLYHYVTFPDENDIIFNGNRSSEIKPSGDYISVMTAIGINF